MSDQDYKFQIGQRVRAGIEMDDQHPGFIGTVIHRERLDHVNTDNIYRVRPESPVSLDDLDKDHLASDGTVTVLESCEIKEL